MLTHEFSDNVPCRLKDQLTGLGQRWSALAAFISVASVSKVVLQYKGWPAPCMQPALSCRQTLADEVVYLHHWVMILEKEESSLVFFKISI